MSVPTAVRFPALSASGKFSNSQDQTNSTNRLNLRVDIPAGESARPTPPFSLESPQFGNLPYSSRSSTNSHTLNPNHHQPHHPLSTRSNFPIHPSKKKNSVSLESQLLKESQESMESRRGGRAFRRSKQPNREFGTSSFSQTGILSARGPARPLHTNQRPIERSSLDDNDMPIDSESAAAASLSVSSYYSVIQSATRAVADSVGELYADDESELALNYNRQGLTVGEIAERVNEFEASKEAFARVNSAVAALRSVDRSGVVGELSQYFQQMKREEKVENRKLELIEFNQLEQQQSIIKTKSVLDAEIQSKHNATAKVLTKYYLHLKTAMRELMNASREEKAKPARAVKGHLHAEAQAQAYREENPFRLDDVEGLNDDEAGNMLKLEIQVGILEAKLADQEQRITSNEGENASKSASELSFEQKAARLLNLIKTLQNARVASDRRVDSLLLERQQMVEKMNSYELMQARLDKLLAEKEESEKKNQLKNENRIQLEESKFVRDQETIEELSIRNENLVKKWNNSELSIEELKSELSNRIELDNENQYKNKNELIRLRIIIQDLMMNRNKEREKRLLLIEELKSLRVTMEDERNQVEMDKLLASIHSQDESEEDKNENKQIIDEANQAIREQTIGADAADADSEAEADTSESQFSPKSQSAAKNSDKENKETESKEFGNSKNSLKSKTESPKKLSPADSSLATVNRQYAEFKLRQSLLHAQKQLKERNSWLKEKFQCQFDRFGNLVNMGKLNQLMKTEKPNAEADAAAEAAAAFVKSPRFKGTMNIPSDSAAAASASSSTLSQLSLQFEIRLKKLAQKLKLTLAQLNGKNTENGKLNEIVTKLRAENRHAETIKLKLGFRIETLQSQLTKLLKATMNMLKKSATKAGSSGAGATNVSALAEILSEIPIPTPAFRAGGGNNLARGLFSQLGFLGLKTQKNMTRGRSSNSATPRIQSNDQSPANEREVADATNPSYSDNSGNSNLSELLARASDVVDSVEQKMRAKQKLREEIAKNRVTRVENDMEIESTAAEAENPVTNKAKENESKSNKSVEEKKVNVNVDKKIPENKSREQRKSSISKAKTAESAKEEIVGPEPVDSALPMPIASAAAEFVLSSAPDADSPNSIESAAFDFLNSLSQTASILAETTEEFDVEDRIEAHHVVESRGEELLDFHSIVRSRVSTPAGSARPVVKEFNGAEMEREADQILSASNFENIMNSSDAETTEADLVNRVDKNSRPNSSQYNSNHAQAQTHSQSHSHSHPHSNSHSRPVVVHSSSRPASQGLAAAVEIANYSLVHAAPLSPRPISAKHKTQTAASIEHTYSHPHSQSREEKRSDKAESKSIPDSTLNSKPKSNQSNRSNLPISSSSSAQIAIDNHSAARQFSHRFPIEVRGQSAAEFDPSKEFHSEPETNYNADSESIGNSPAFPTRKVAKSKSQRRIIPKANSKQLQLASSFPIQPRMFEADTESHSAPADNEPADEIPTAEEEEKEKHIQLLNAAAGQLQSLTFEINRTRDENDELRRALAHRSGHVSHAISNDETREQAMPSAIAAPDSSLLAGSNFTSTAVIASKYRANMEYYSLKLSDQQKTIESARRQLDKQKQLNLILAQFIQRIMKQRQKWVRRADKPKYSATQIKNDDENNGESEKQKAKQKRQRQQSRTATNANAGAEAVTQDRNESDKESRTELFYQPNQAERDQSNQNSDEIGNNSNSDSDDSNDVDSGDDDESQNENPNEIASAEKFLAAEDLRLLDYVDSITSSSQLLSSPLLNDPWHRESTEKLYFTNPIFSYPHGLNLTQLNSDELNDSQLRSGSDWPKYQTAIAQSIVSQRTRGGFSALNNSASHSDLPIDQYSIEFAASKIPTDAIYSTFQPKYFHSKQLVSPGNGSVFHGYTHEAGSHSHINRDFSLSVRGNKLGGEYRKPLEGEREDKRSQTRKSADEIVEVNIPGLPNATNENGEFSYQSESKQSLSEEKQPESKKRDKSVGFEDEENEKSSTDRVSNLRDQSKSVNAKNNIIVADTSRLEYFDHSQTLISSIVESPRSLSKRHLLKTFAYPNAPGIPKNFANVLTVRTTGRIKRNEKSENENSSLAQAIID